MESVRGVGGTSAAGQGNHHRPVSPVHSHRPLDMMMEEEKRGESYYLFMIFFWPPSQIYYFCYVNDFIYKHVTTDHRQKIQTPIAKANQFLRRKEKGWKMFDFETGLQNAPVSPIFSSSWYSITYQLYSTCCLDWYKCVAKSSLLRLLCMKYKLHNWEQCQLEWFWQWRWLQGQFYEVMAGVRYKRYPPPEALWLPTTTALGNFNVSFIEINFLSLLELPKQIGLLWAQTHQWVFCQTSLYLKNMFIVKKVKKDKLFSNDPT